MGDLCLPTLECFPHGKHCGLGNSGGNHQEPAQRPRPMHWSMKQGASACPKGTPSGESDYGTGHPVSREPQGTKAERAPRGDGSSGEPQVITCKEGISTEGRESTVGCSFFYSFIYLAKKKKEKVPLSFTIQITLGRGSRNLRVAPWVEERSGPDSSLPLLRPSLTPQHLLPISLPFSPCSAN